MILPLPPMYGEIMTACAAGEWRVTEYDGTGFSGQMQHRYCGVIAIRGDIRVQVEWVCEAAARKPATPWQHRSSSIAIRHPDHDPADFARVWPARWFAPDTKDPHRRCTVTAVWPAVRLLGRPDDVLADVVLNQQQHRPRRRSRQ